MNVLHPRIEAYVLAHTIAERPWLKRLARETRRRTENPGMMVGAVEGAFLRLLVRLVKPKTLLEIGTFTGYSALAMAEALPPGGRLIACDVNPDTSAIARRHWAKTPYASKITLHLGPALATVNALRGPIDMAFIDANKENYPRYWDAVVPKLRKGGLMVVDNVLRDGRVLDPRNEQGRIMAAFNRKVARDARMEHVMLSVRDGVTLAWKK